MAEGGEPAAYLVGDVALERQAGGRVRPLEEQVAQAEQAHQLGHRVRVVVDAQVDEDVAAAAVTASGPDDEQRRALPAAGVAAGAVAREQGVEQPVAERASGVGLAPGLLDGVDHLRAGEDVALDRVRRPAAASRRWCHRPTGSTPHR